MSSLKLKDGNLVLKTPFNRALIDDLKSTIPLYGRAWNPQEKVWEVAYMHGQDVVDIVKRHLNENLSIPKQVTQVNTLPVTKLLKVEYIGAVKERETGEMTATGYYDGQWSVIFPLKVLREWFEGNGDKPLKPNEAPSFYSILGVGKKASSKEVKTAYRIAAKTWHPDLNQEPNAAEQFRRVNQAYETLSNDQQRRKYDAGLYLQSHASKEQKSFDDIFNNTLNRFNVWLPPKKCGFLTVVGTEALGRLSVDKILSWQDVINDAGMIMVSTWRKGDDKFSIDWI